METLLLGLVVPGLNLAISLGGYVALPYAHGMLDDGGSMLELCAICCLLGVTWVDARSSL